MNKRWIGVLCGLAWGAAAQTEQLPPDTPERIDAQRQALTAQRTAIEAQHDARQRECWQRFAVNDCLMGVRRSRFAALDPVRDQELAFNALERRWRTQERQRRLQEKAERSPGTP